MGSVLLLSLIVAVVGLFLGVVIQDAADTYDSFNAGSFLGLIGLISAIVFIGSLLLVVGRFVYSFFT